MERVWDSTGVWVWWLPSELLWLCITDSQWLNFFLFSVPFFCTQRIYWHHHKRTYVHHLYPHAHSLSDMAPHSHESPIQHFQCKISPVVIWPPSGVMCWCGYRGAHPALTWWRVRGTPVPLSYISYLSGTFRVAISTSCTMSCIAGTFVVHVAWCTVHSIRTNSYS